MNIFISWSGERSKYIAESIRLWLPKVIQAVKPWMSNEDIESGKRWSNDIMQELESSKFGIICITPENQVSPWIMFESGALSKTLEQTYVCPLVYDMTPSELSNPLSQFQARSTEKEGVFKLIKTINSALGSKAIKNEELEEIFNVWWPQLELKINECPAYDGVKIKERSTEDILKELVDNTREQLRREELRIEKSIVLDDKMDFLVGYLESMKNIPSLLNSILSNNSKSLGKYKNIDITKDSLEATNNSSNNFISEILEKMKEIKDTNDNFKESLLNKPNK